MARFHDLQHNAKAVSPLRFHHDLLHDAHRTTKKGQSTLHKLLLPTDDEFEKISADCRVEKPVVAQHRHDNLVQELDLQRQTEYCTVWTRAPVAAQRRARSHRPKNFTVKSPGFFALCVPVCGKLHLSLAPCTQTVSHTSCNQTNPRVDGRSGQRNERSHPREHHQYRESGWSSSYACAKVHDEPIQHCTTEKYRQKRVGRKQPRKRDCTSERPIFWA